MPVRLPATTSTPRQHMHPSEDEDDHPHHLVSGDGPINRRTALKQERSQGSAVRRELHPQLQGRMDRVHARHQFGAPLQEHLSSFPASEQAPASGLHIGVGVLAACGCLLALLGAIQSSMVLVAAGAAIAACGALGWKVVHGTTKTASLQDTAGAPLAWLFDAQTLAVFDAAVEKAAPELDEACAARLLAIKETFKRMGSQAATAHDEHFTVDDRLYLRECLRRYVPDSLQAYLRVPAAQRLEALLDNQPCAQTALLQQLDLLLDGVRLREKKIGRSAAEGLVRQQQFLASKTSR